MFICLLEIIVFKESLYCSNKDKASQNTTKLQFLTQQLTNCSSNPHFFYYFSQVIEQVCSANLSKCGEFVLEMSKCLKLNLPLQIIISTSMALSYNQIISREGFYFS